MEALLLNVCPRKEKWNEMKKFSKYIREAELYTI